MTQANPFCLPVEITPKFNLFLEKVCIRVTRSVAGDGFDRFFF